MRCHRTPGPAARPGRPLRALVAVALVAGALTACGGSSDSGGGSSIVVTHGYTDAEATALKAAVGTWNLQHPDEKVSLQFNGGNDSALQKTVAGFAAGNYPDVAYQYGSSAAQLVRQPKLVDLTDRVQADSVDWNDFYPSAREAVDRRRQGRRCPGPDRQPQPGLQQGALRPGPRRPADERLDLAGLPRRGQEADRREQPHLRLGLRQRRQRGHGLAVPRPALAGRGRPADLRQHPGGVRLRRRQGCAAAAPGHGGDRQVRVPRPGQRPVPQPVQQRKDRDALDRALGPVEHQLRRAVRRDLPAGLQRQPRDDLRPRPLHAVRPLGGPVEVGVRLHHVADLGPAAHQVRDRDRRPAAASVGDHSCRATRRS